MGRRWLFTILSIDDGGVNDNGRPREICGRAPGSRPRHMYNSHRRRNRALVLSARTDGPGWRRLYVKNGLVARLPDRRPHTINGHRIDYLAATRVSWKRRGKYRPYRRHNKIPVRFRLWISECKRNLPNGRSGGCAFYHRLF